MASITQITCFAGGYGVATFMNSWYRDDDDHHHLKQKKQTKKNSWADTSTDVFFALYHLFLCQQNKERFIIVK